MLGGKSFKDVIALAVLTHLVEVEKMEGVWISKYKTVKTHRQSMITCQ